MTTTKDEVVFLNPNTCGIYKSGGPRYKTDPFTGRRSSEIDNEMMDAVTDFLSSSSTRFENRARLAEVYLRRVLVPTYYNARFVEGMRQFLIDNALEPITVGQLIEDGTIVVRQGHGSPGNDQRTGSIPYIKVSDIRALRININPTNLVSESIARRFWRGDNSGIQPWDLITPNRASSNIGEFALILPGEERVVLTKEVFVFRVIDDTLIDPFYLLWALSLKVVREQWRRIALMQTNREDCGDRYLEIILPKPKSREWGLMVSEPFREYFTSLSTARSKFSEKITESEFEYTANVGANPMSADLRDEAATDDSTSG